MSTVDVKVSGKIYDSKKEATLIVSKELVNQVSYLHKEVKKIEWSGVLLYEVLSGDINNPEEMVIKAHKLYLMDVGTSGYTEYELNENQFDMFDEIPECDPIWCEENNATPWRRGHIHTHHNMGTFFSGTDQNELIDNAPKYDYYLSLIVNFACDFKAKIAIEGKIESSTKYQSKTGEISGNESNNDSCTFTVDMNVAFEGEADINEKIESIKDSKRKVTPSYGSRFGVGTGGHYGRDDYYGSDYYSPAKTVDTKKELTSAPVTEFLIKLVSLNKRTYSTIHLALNGMNIEYNTEVKRSEYEVRIADEFLDIYHDIFDDYVDFEEVINRAKLMIGIFRGEDDLADIIYNELEAWEPYSPEEIKEQEEKEAQSKQIKMKL